MKENRCGKWNKYCALVMGITSLLSCLVGYLCLNNNKTVLLWRWMVKPIPISYTLHQHLKPRNAKRASRASGTFSKIVTRLALSESRSMYRYNRTPYFLLTPTVFYYCWSRKGIGYGPRLCWRIELRTGILCFWSVNV